jgi:hypothetical protein
MTGTDLTVGIFVCLLVVMGAISLIFANALAKVSRKVDRLLKIAEGKEVSGTCQCFSLYGRRTTELGICVNCKLPTEDREKFVGQKT